MSEIEERFEQLKANGLQAKNPDQSSCMMEAFHNVVKTCRWKGFSDEDIVVLFNTAFILLDGKEPKPEQAIVKAKIALLQEIVDEWDPYSPHDEFPGIEEKLKDLKKELE